MHFFEREISDALASVASRERLLDLLFTVEIVPLRRMPRGLLRLTLRGDGHVRCDSLKQASQKLVLVPIQAEQDMQAQMDLYKGLSADNDKLKTALRVKTRCGDSSNWGRLCNMLMFSIPTCVDWPFRCLAKRTSSIDPRARPRRD